MPTSRNLTWWILLSAVVPGASRDPPPPLCRDGSGDSAYECLLCSAHDAALREGVTYLLNGDCTFNPLEAPVVLSSAVVVTEGVRIRPLDINSATPIAGQLVVTGSNVQIRDVVISDTVVVQGEAVTGLKLTNITTVATTLVLDVSPTKVHHDIDVTGLVATGLQTVATEADPAALQPVATLFHSYGNMQISCTGEQTVVVQPMIPSGIATLSACNVINFTAILDAYGNAFTYDLYGTPTPRWLVTLRSWAITLTAVSAGLILLTRKPSATATAPAPRAPEKAKWV